MLRQILVLFLALMLQASPAHAQVPEEPDEIVYTAREGDNLYTLAERHFIRLGDYLPVQRLNRIRDPRRIPVGTKLRIPRTVLKYEPITARILSFRGAVQLRRDGRDLAVSPQMPVREGDRLSTGANAFVSLGMPDGSAVALPSQSRVTVQQLRRISLTGAVVRRFAVEQGRARAVVSPIEQEDEFHISTPIAVSAVRGTEFRVSYDGEAARANTETLSGEVTMSGGGDARNLAAGFGSIASGDGLSAPIALLAPPRLISPGRIQDEAELIFELEPLPGAGRYHVQLAQDAGFLDAIGETVSDETRISLPPIPDGTWFVRISAFDSNGLEGMYETYGFQRRLNTITASVEEVSEGDYRQYLFRWNVMGEGKRQYRFQLSRDEDGSDPVVDELGLADTGFVITDLPPGTYFWRVMTMQFSEGQAHGKWSPMERLTISPPQ